MMVVVRMRMSDDGDDGDDDVEVKEDEEDGLTGFTSASATSSRASSELLRRFLCCCECVAAGAQSGCQRRPNCGHTFVRLPKRKC